jgi:hypothetical protein
MMIGCAPAARTVPMYVSKSVFGATNPPSTVLVYQWYPSAYPPPG